MLKLTENQKPTSRTWRGGRLLVRPMLQTSTCFEHCSYMMHTPLASKLAVKKNKENEPEQRGLSLSCFERKRFLPLPLISTLTPYIWVVLVAFLFHG